MSAYIYLNLNTSVEEALSQAVPAFNIQQGRFVSDVVILADHEERREEWLRLLYALEWMTHEKILKYDPDLNPRFSIQSLIQMTEDFKQFLENQSPSRHLPLSLLMFLVQGAELNTPIQYQQWRSQLPERLRKKIPHRPDQIYKDWVSWRHLFGAAETTTVQKVSLPELKSIISEQGVKKTVIGFRNWRNSLPPHLKIRIPADPVRTLKNEGVTSYNDIFDKTDTDFFETWQEQQAFVSALTYGVSFSSLKEYKKWVDSLPPELRRKNCQKPRSYVPESRLARLGCFLKKTSFNGFQKIKKASSFTTFSKPQRI